ncbi:hypothetical protein AB0D33_17440 [Streptomyces sp. NPDC048404]|uniref:hypothetical protein n=1 Tax=unclassified Streptomyces TaxID=2593676 RepID=UPI003424A735
MAKTDSGWALLAANLLLCVLAAGVFTHLSASRNPLFLILAISVMAHAARTVYVMICVARGETGRPAPGDSPGPPSGPERHR